jgi:transposase
VKTHRLRLQGKGNGMNLIVGLDVSLAMTAVCVLDARGQIVREAKVESNPDALLGFFRDLDACDPSVGLEAGPLSQWLYRHLREAGYDVTLMETRQVKGALKAMPVKTDRRDAEGIARLLHMGWFRPVHCKSLSAQEMRAVLSARKSVKKAALDIELSVRGVLRNFGLKMGQVAVGRFDARVRELIADNPMLMAAAEPLLQARANLRRELARLERLLRDMVKADPPCRLMMTMPGIGPVVALTMRAAIDDPTRFRSSKDVGPWAGLTPSRHQSGERDVIGAITRAGDAGVRAALFQAATVMLNRGAKSWLTAWAQKVAGRRGRKRATVALARRIGVILHRMWSDGTEFRFTRTVDVNTAVA